MVHLCVCVCACALADEHICADHWFSMKNIKNRRTKGGVLSLSVLAAAGATSGSGHLLTKITRTDPALVQYAVQAFGTSNLSEDDWKKAEDHYKVMFVYIFFVHGLSCAVLLYMLSEITSK